MSCTTIKLHHKSRIVLANRHYKRAVDLNVGDRLLYTKMNEMSLYEAYVFDVKNRKLTEKDTLYSWSHPSLYHPHHFLDSHNLLTSKGVKSVSNIKQNDRIVYECNKSDYTNKKDDISYKYGYIVSTILFAGFVHTPDTCVIMFDKRDVLQKFFKYWSDLFGYGHVMKITKPATVYKFQIDSKSLFKLFYEKQYSKLIINSIAYSDGYMDGIATNYTHNIDKALFDLVLKEQTKLDCETYLIDEIKQTNGSEDEHKDGIVHIGLLLQDSTSDNIIMNVDNFALFHNRDNLSTCSINWEY